MSYDKDALESISKGVTKGTLEYSEEKIDTTIEIFIKTTDLNILSFFTGETKLTFGLYINEIQNRNVTILS